MGWIVQRTPRVDALEASFQWRNGESTVAYMQRQLDAMTELARELEEMCHHEGHQPPNGNE